MLKVLSLQIVCTEDEIDHIIKKFYNTDLAQEGVYCFGGEQRDITNNEFAEIEGEVDTEMFRLYVNAEDFYQCGSYESVYTHPDNNGDCLYCHSGNWVKGYIDDPEPE